MSTVRPRAVKFNSSPYHFVSLAELENIIGSSFQQIVENLWVRRRIARRDILFTFDDGETLTRLSAKKTQGRMRVSSINIENAYVEVAFADETVLQHMWDLKFQSTLDHANVDLPADRIFITAVDKDMPKSVLKRLQEAVVSTIKPFKGGSMKHLLLTHAKSTALGKTDWEKVLIVYDSTIWRKPIRKSTGREIVKFIGRDYIPIANTYQGEVVLSKTNGEIPSYLGAQRI